MPARKWHPDLRQGSAGGEPEPSEAIENERRLFYVALTRAKKEVYIGTVKPPVNSSSSPKPSRFLDEIRRVPTARIMEALQRLASGDRKGRQELIKWLKLYGNIPLISRALTAEYLRDVGDGDLLAEVSRLVASLPEKAFGYRFPHTPPTVSSKHQGLHKVWEEVRM